MEILVCSASALRSLAASSSSRRVFTTAGSTSTTRQRHQYYCIRNHSWRADLHLRTAGSVGFSCPINCRTAARAPRAISSRLVRGSARWTSPRSDCTSRSRLATSIPACAFVAPMYRASLTLANAIAGLWLTLETRYPQRTSSWARVRSSLEKSARANTAAEQPRATTADPTDGRRLHRDRRTRRDPAADSAQRHAAAAVRCIVLLILRLKHARR